MKNEKFYTRSKNVRNSKNILKYQRFFFFLGGGKDLVLVSWQAFHFILMKLDFMSQPSSKSTLPFAGLQHMQQCCNFCFHALIQMNGAWNMVSTMGSGFETMTFQSWVFCLNHWTTATRHKISKIIKSIIVEFFFIGYNLTSHNLIVFKSLVWKKGDESFQKIPFWVWAGIKPRSSCTVGMCATNAPLAHLLWLKDIL